MSSMPKSIVIGTAGHIDHGKTALVRALTGVDTDRLPEEKRRGITIDLGFASVETTLPGGAPLRISFVDVPGHSLFIRNMLAGAGCVSTVMLVIAANEGIRPQTQEHLAICELLGIEQGLTVITKTDTVNRSQLHDVRGSIEVFLRGSFLDTARAPVMAVSCLTGEGVESVRETLINLATCAPRASTDAVLRMPLDRSFVMKGFGTVVTGSLISGTLREGQALQLEPKSRIVRVRGLQTSGRAEPSADAGSRVAVNLSGADATEIERGQMLVLPSTLSAVDTFDAEVRLVGGARTLKHRVRVHLHAFTAESMATVFLYGYDAIQPQTVRMARVKLAHPMVLVPGDRFVLRQPLPAGTIGGGRVLDAHPELRQRKAASLAWLEQLRSSSIAQQITLRVRRRNTSGMLMSELSAETGLTQEALRREIGGALESGELLAISDDLLVSREAVNTAITAITSRLQADVRAVKRSELRSQTGLGPDVFDFILNALVRERKLRLSGESVSIESATGGVSDDDAHQRSAVAHIYRTAGLAAPSVLEIAQRLNLRETDMRRVVTELLRCKTIVRMGTDDLFMHSDALTELTKQLTALRGAVMDVAQFKQFTGLSRKYAIPLLEYLDRQRITRKVGDQRLVL